MEQRLELNLLFDHFITDLLPITLLSFELNSDFQWSFARTRQTKAYLLLKIEVDFERLPFNSHLETLLRLKELPGPLFPLKPLFARRFQLALHFTT